MHKFAIVETDHPDPGVPDARPLRQFLDVFDPGSVVVTTPSRLLAEPPLACEHLLLALPTTFGPRHLDRVRARRIHLFDYFDSTVPTWMDSDIAFLRSVTDRYLKSSWMSDASYGFRAGLLPIVIRSRIARAYREWRLSAPLRRLGRALGRDERPWDISLLGSATYQDDHLPDGRHVRYHQRVEWMREVRAHPRWRFWGGLYELPYCRIDRIESECGPVGDIFEGAERLHHRSFFRRMTQTRVALCPLGHARWTYRHFESIYAGCEIVSCDLRRLRTLVPLPLHCMAMVADHESIVAAVDLALAERPQRRARREAALEFCERHLRLGAYDRGRPLPYETFIAQLEN